MERIDCWKLKTAEIRFWLGQAFISLLAAFIVSQNITHGTLAVMPTKADVIPILITFAIIFALVVSVTLISRRMNVDPE